MEKSKPNKYRRLVKNIILFFVGNFVTRILTFLMVPFYTSILSTSDYGTSDLISTTVMLVLPLFSMLMDEAVLRFTLDEATDNKQAFTIAFTISTIGFLAVMCLSPIVLLFDGLKQYYWFIVLYYVVSWIYNIANCYVRGLDKVSVTTVAGIIHTFVYLALNIVLLAVIKIGVYGYLLAIDISNLVAAAFLFVYCKLYKNFIPIKKIDKIIAKKMVKYSLPMIPNYITWWVNNASDRYILSAMCGKGANGVYAAAYKIPGILNSVTAIFASAWTISSVENFGSKESIDFYNKTYRLYGGFLAICGAGITIISKLLAKVLFAKDFFVAWKITPILVLAYVFSAHAQFVGSIFTASKKTQKLFIAPLVGAIVNTILNFLLIPILEGTGAAIATVVGYVSIWTVQIILTKKILVIDYNLKRTIPSSVLIITEIIAVLSDSLAGYIIAALAVILVIVINGREFLQILSMAKNKLIRKKD